MNNSLMSLRKLTDPEAVKVIDVDFSAIGETYANFKKESEYDKNRKFINYRIKMPAAGGGRFQIITDDKEFNESNDALVSTFEAVIINDHYANALYPLDEKEQFIPDALPLCQSYNGLISVADKNGVVHDCISCEHNQFGSGKDGRGKRCKNTVRLYLLMDGVGIPFILSIPPTSIKNWNAYKNRILIKRLLIKDCITEFSLSKENGKNYHTCSFTLKGVINKEAKNITLQLAEGAKFNKEMTADDYNTKSSIDIIADEISSIELTTDDDLPF